MTAVTLTKVPLVDRLQRMAAREQTTAEALLVEAVTEYLSDTVEVIETPLAFAVIGRDLPRYFNRHIYGREQLFELEIA